MNSGLLTRVLSSAQLRVEGLRFDQRKYLLKYDEVLRVQREIMYSKRDEILACEDPKEILKRFYTEAADYLVEHSVTDIDGEMAIDERVLEDLTKSHLGVYIDYPVAARVSHFVLVVVNKAVPTLAGVGGVATLGAGGRCHLGL